MMAVLNYPIRIFTGRIILIYNDDYHEVDIWTSKTKPKKGFGYIRKGAVYIYRGKADKKIDMNKPGIYQDKKGEYLFVEPSEEEMELYSINNITELDVGKIFNDINENTEEFEQPDDVEVINSNSSIFTPTIKDTDDFLKLAVKKFLLETEPDLNNKYKSKFSNQYQLNNLKSNLKGSSKMSIQYFRQWEELLNFGWKIEIYDKGSPAKMRRGLNDTIIITSED